MISRIAKNFQDYFMNVVIQKFGAKVFTDGLTACHETSLPGIRRPAQRGNPGSIAESADRYGEIHQLFHQCTLWGHRRRHIRIYLCGHLDSLEYPVGLPCGYPVLTWITNLLSKKIKIIQKNIVSQTTSLAGSTTESLRNIELVKSLGLTQEEVNRLNKNTYKILGLELTKVKRIRSISFVQGTFVNTLRQVILFILMWLIFRDKMNAGQLVTMQIFSFFVFGPLQDIGNIVLSYREAEASLNNFEALMKKVPEPEAGKSQTPGQYRRTEFPGTWYSNIKRPSITPLTRSVLTYR